MTKEKKILSPSPENTPKRKLKSGWTTGTCATAATKAALQGLFTSQIPKQVEIITPSGKIANLKTLDTQILSPLEAKACIIKDAGDDPDITHGAKICALVRQKQDGKGGDIRFLAGKGVGVVTKAGLPLAIGEPAINPVPRQMMRDIVHEMVKTHHGDRKNPYDYDIEITVSDGEKLAEQTWNPRLGIIGGISILGTSGVVRPFSCAAWIASIHRGIDVGRANGISHMIAATGNQSEASARKTYAIQDIGAIDMGDFIGGMLKYMRKHPIEKLTIAGGVAKMTKFSQGAMDLHSKRSQIDFSKLSKLAIQEANIAPEKLENLNTMLDLLQRLSDAEKNRLLPLIAKKCQKQAYEILRHDIIKINIMLCDRQGNPLYETGFDG